MTQIPCWRLRFLAWANPIGCSVMSNNLIPPSLRPAKVRGEGRAPPTEGEEPRPPPATLPLDGVDPALDKGEVNPPKALGRLGMPFSGVVSVILRGMPLERSGTVGAGFFLRLL